MKNLKKKLDVHCALMLAKLRVDGLVWGKNSRDKMTLLKH